MHATVRPLAICAFAVAMLLARSAGVALAETAPPAHPPVLGEAPPSYSGPGWATEEESAVPPESAPLMDEPVLYVTSVEILRAAAPPQLDIVRVIGLAASEGWSAPQLVPTYAGKPSDGILDLELIATPPDHSQEADGFVPVSAILPLEPGHPFKGVRVRGSENAIALKQIPGSAQASIDVNDCKDCAGKKFAPEGSAPQSQQGVVRQENLPKFLRIVKASDGIRDAEQDPNRLTLILGEDGTILEAFWE
jgi:hypothetical protein